MDEFFEVRFADYLEASRVPGSGITLAEMAEVTAALQSKAEMPSHIGQVQRQVVKDAQDAARLQVAFQDVSAGLRLPQFKLRAPGDYLFAVIDVDLQGLLQTEGDRFAIKNRCSKCVADKWRRHPGA